MQYYFMGYNKDRDIYDCLVTVDTIQMIQYKQLKNLANIIRQCCVGTN